jgi:drug/metabolite transporter (DMT)-like permease
MSLCASGSCADHFTLRRGRFAQNMSTCAATDPHRKRQRALRLAPQNIDGINLYGLISGTALLICLPAALFFEGAQLGAATATATAALGSQAALVQLLLAGGLFYHLYNAMAYQVLNQGVGPVTWSMYNTIKRAIVVVAAVLVFHHPMTLLNWIGSGIAIAGTYAYTVCRQPRGARA